MNPLPKTSFTLGRLVSKAHPRPNYICIQCRYRAISHLQKSAFSTFSSKKAGKKLEFTERLRRKIWGTDNPPGPADPYAYESELDRSKRLEQELSTPDPSSDVDTTTAPADIQSDYVPATTWDGLEQIGGATGWWEQAWDQENQFRGFMASSKLESKDDVGNAIRRALVEVYTLVEAGRSPTDATNALDDMIIPNTSLVSFDTAADGSVSLVFPDEQIRQDVLDSTIEAEPIEEVLEVQAESEDEQSAGATDLGSVEATSIDDLTSESDRTVEDLASESDSIVETLDHDTSTSVVEGDNSWKNVIFKDPTIKFAILKRVMQLTGKRIPDPIISEIGTAKALFGHLVIKPKPKKLAESLLQTEHLVSIPNVELMARRYTPIDREKEIGRWKVIERELERRGLPVTGNGNGNS